MTAERKKKQQQTNKRIYPEWAFVKGGVLAVGAWALSGYRALHPLWPPRIPEKLNRQRRYTERKIITSERSDELVIANDGGRRHSLWVSSSSFDQLEPRTRHGGSIDSGAAAAAAAVTAVLLSSNGVN